MFTITIIWLPAIDVLNFEEWINSITIAIIRSTTSSLFF